MGPLVLGVGIWVLFTTDLNDTREYKIAQVNTDISAWNTTIYPAFNSTSFEVELNDLDVQLNLTHMSDMKLSAQFGKSGLSYYTAAKFTTTQNFFSNTPMPFNQSTTVEIVFTSGSSTFNWTTPLFRLHNTTANSVSCNNTGGKFDNRTNLCFFYYSLSYFCVKVFNTPDKKWALSSQYGGIGCDYDADEGKMLPALYTQIAPPATPATPVNMGKLQVLLRHLNDPYVLASYLTKGSLDFGLSRLQKALLAIVLIGVGALCMIPCICSVVCLFAVFFLAYQARKRDGYSPIQN